MTQFSLVSDIEGAEVGIVLDDSSALQRCVTLIIEVHDAFYRGSPVTAETTVQRLQAELGFRLIARCGRVCVLERA